MSSVSILYTYYTIVMRTISISSRYLSDGSSDSVRTPQRMVVGWCVSTYMIFINLPIRFGDSSASRVLRCWSTANGVSLLYFSSARGKTATVTKANLARHSAVAYAVTCGEFGSSHSEIPVYKWTEHNRSRLCWWLYS